MPAGEHLQCVKRKVHSGQEAAFTPSGGHDAADSISLSGFVQLRAFRILHDDEDRISSEGSMIQDQHCLKFHVSHPHSIASFNRPPSHRLTFNEPR